MSAIQKRIHEAALRLFAQKPMAEINISELAQSAGLARNTVYKHLDSIDKLLATLATDLASEMNQRVSQSTATATDPAVRLANGIRFYVRRAHEEPHWGRFLQRYGMSLASLQALWDGPLVADVTAGLFSQRYQFKQEQLLAVIGLIGAAVLGAITLVVQGQRTWRDAGADTAELILRALGVPQADAQVLANLELPALPELI
ncbi:TetR/AcrR family transcriptional regulator [Pseudomonas sp. 5P_3.1_Bac2]|uniref:TetR/AcrR family transcriptional regulator n=1 Tax=Pseudomonas sp. 5P_3.1_Bac2 TaxID=2971617 RepID=UPI0021CA019A|nr:TetR/AcrR family transcriptional regulator [Pseudomonas sp. 5P_3.1_Bac2]MCU1718713.1 TetR/AcrR family transcriptional regulator [Pseudomonas sp. 5P_3.1_Bac2]